MADLEGELRGLNAAWEARWAAQRASIAASHEASLSAVAAERDRAVATLEAVRASRPRGASALDSFDDGDDGGGTPLPAPSSKDGGASGAELLRHIAAMEGELSQARGETSMLRQQLQAARLSSAQARSEAVAAQVRRGGRARGRPPSHTPPPRACVQASSERAAIAQAHQTSVASASGLMSSDLGGSPGGMPSWLQVRATLGGARAPRTSKGAP